VQIKKLIDKLQAIYEIYDDEYKQVMGEPEIVVDVFVRAKTAHTFLYAGFAGQSDIVIDNSEDGVYKIISAFAEDYEDQRPTRQTTQSASSANSVSQSG
jgi:hypothetical protein